MILDNTSTKVFLMFCAISSLRDSTCTSYLFNTRLLRKAHATSNPMLGFYPDELAALLTKAPSHDAHHLVFIMTVMRAHRLNELFQFAGIDPSWTEQTVQLVRVFHPGGDRSPRAQVYNSALSNMSRETTRATDSADWLSHETKAPFCLSSSFSHADVLFVLRLEDGRLLYVALAVLFKNAHVEVDAAKIQATFAQLAPHRLFKVRCSSIPRHGSES